MNNITYMTGLLTFYLKGNISADQNFVRLKIPNTILSLIPLGAQERIYRSIRLPRYLQISGYNLKI